MEPLAYIHLALAYESASDTGTVALLRNLKAEEELNRQKPIARASIHLLSIALPLAVLNILSSSGAVQLEDSGSEVTELQNNLKTAAYYDGPATGYYGSLTQAAVKQFQAARGLIADGVAGEKTLEALQQYLDGKSTGSIVFSIARRGLRLGDRGAEVKEIQQSLKAAGFNPGAIDRKFGSQTERSVRQFQANRGLSVDGIVGRETWFALRHLGSSISPYLVIITPESADTLSQVLTYVPDAYLDKFSFNPDINAGAFPNYYSAKRHRNMLRSHGLKARVAYIR